MSSKFKSSTSVRNGVAGLIGNTHLLRLHALSEATGCEILGKAEFLNPGGSVKDRAALSLIEDAIAKRLLKPGGTVVEGTAGNTGIGLTLVANAKGLKTIIVIPETQSSEKINTLRGIGAKVITVPAVPYSDPENYNHVAKRIAEETEGAFWTNQFDNLANADAHYKTTGPEIWEQSEGKITAFVSAVGTGGTIAGVSKFLKEKNPKIEIICADPHGASIWSWVKRGNLDYDEGDSVTEGIGQGRVTGNLAGAIIDDAYRIGDPVILEMAHFLANTEGFFLGSSSAINLCAAVRYARLKGPGQVIVTPLCDSGHRYVSKIYNPAWLKEKGLEPKATRLKDFWDDLMTDGVD